MIKVSKNIGRKIMTTRIAWAPLIGLGVLLLGVAALVLGVVTMLNPQLALPGLALIALGVGQLLVGAILFVLLSVMVEITGLI